jgi:hypothetical protein
MHSQEGPEERMAPILIGEKTTPSHEGESRLNQYLFFPPKDTQPALLPVGLIHIMYKDVENNV